MKQVRALQSWKVNGVQSDNLAVLQETHNDVTGGGRTNHVERGKTGSPGVKLKAETGSVAKIITSDETFIALF